jgi:outer membrane protein OmpA-like peptidoglycan-associated protein
MSQFSKIIVLAVAVMTMAACANNPNKRAGYGAGIGAGAGAAIGYGIGGDVLGTVVGSAVGALAGAGVGHYLDAQQQALQKKLAKERAAKELQVSKLNEDALKVGVAGDASFDVDSAQIKPQFEPAYQKIASVLKQYPKSIIHVVGFTDSTGSANYNLGLSQRRAQSVANYLQAQGVSQKRLMTEGRGETQPVASNTTPAGRKQNRRVAIVIKPVIKGNKQEAYQPPPPLGSAG